MNDAHTAAAAAHRRLHDDGIADLPRNFLRFHCRLDRVLGSGQNWNTCRCGQSSSGSLVSQQLEEIWRRANESDARFFAGAGECRILGEETVTRVDGVDALLLR